MSGRNGYTAPLVAQCRADMTAMAAAWRAVARRSAPQARAEAEAQVFNQMVVALEGRLAQLLRGVAGKDDTPLDEVRLLALGVTGNGGYFPDNAAIPWRPESSVTGYRTGDRIVLSEPVFLRLVEACLAGIAAKIAA